MFFVPKKASTSRLNESIDYEHFKMSTVHEARMLTQKKFFMASVDLEKAYYSIPIHDHLKIYLQFKLDGKVFEY